jgi:hypothetical protein
VPHQGKVSGHSHAAMTRPEHGNSFSFGFSCIVHDFLIVASHQQYKKFPGKTMEKSKKVEDCRIGEPAVFAALKRTYGKKE